MMLLFFFAVACLDLILLLILFLIVSIVFFIYYYYYCISNVYTVKALKGFICDEAPLRYIFTHSLTSSPLCNMLFNHTAIDLPVFLLPGIQTSFSCDVFLYLRIDIG